MKTVQTVFFIHGGKSIVARGDNGRFCKYYYHIGIFYLRPTGTFSYFLNFFPNFESWKDRCGSGGGERPREKGLEKKRAKLPVTIVLGGVASKRQKSNQSSARSRETWRGPPSENYNVVMLFVPTVISFAKNFPALQKLPKHDGIVL